MTRTATETIAKNNVDAGKAVAAIKTAIHQKATGMTYDAGALNDLVLALAHAEGELRVWARLEHYAMQLSKQGQGEMTEETAKSVVFDMLAAGPDDTWSGRGNEVARARFDGVRAAAQKVEWIF